MYTLLILFYLGGTTLQLVKCFSDGNFDDFPDVCYTMKTEHDFDTTLPSSTTHQFTIVPDCFIATQSDLSCTVSLKSSGQPFRGFMLEARDINDNVPLGEFSVLNPAISRVQTCNGGPSAVTQTDNQDKSEVNVMWIAPAPGTYYFVATFVQHLISWTRTSINTAQCQTLTSTSVASTTTVTELTTQPPHENATATTLVPTSTLDPTTEDITSTGTTITSTSTSATSQISDSTTITEVITSLVTLQATSTTFTTSPDNTAAKATTPISMATSDLITGLTTSTVSTTGTVFSTVDNGNSSSTIGNNASASTASTFASTEGISLTTTVTEIITSLAPTSTTEPTRTPLSLGTTSTTYASTQVSTSHPPCQLSQSGTDSILVLLLLSYLFLAVVFLLLVKHRKRKCLVAMKVCSILSAVLSTVAFILLLVLTKLVAAQVLTGLAVLLNLFQITVVFLFRGPSHELRRHFCWAFGLFAFVNFCLISAAVFVGLWFFKNQCSWLLIVMAVYLACDLLFVLYFSNFACKALGSLHRKMTSSGSCYRVSLIIIILVNVAFTTALIAGTFVCLQPCVAS